MRARVKPRKLDPGGHPLWGHVAGAWEATHGTRNRILDHGPGRYTANITVTTGNAGSIWKHGPHGLYLDSSVSLVWDAVTVAHVPRLKAAKNVTYEFFVDSKGSSGNSTVFAWNDAGGFYIVVKSGDLYTGKVGQSQESMTTSGTFTSGVWRHVHVVIGGDGKACKVYIDGVLDRSFTMADALNPAGALTLTHPSYPMTCAVLFWRIYDIALQPAEIAALARDPWLLYRIPRPLQRKPAGGITHQGDAAGDSETLGEAAGATLARGTAEGGSESDGLADGTVRAGAVAEGGSDSDGSATGSLLVGGAGSGDSDTDGEVIGQAIIGGTAEGASDTDGEATASEPAYAESVAESEGQVQGLVRIPGEAIGDSESDGLAEASVRRGAQAEGSSESDAEVSGAVALGASGEGASESEGAAEAILVLYVTADGTSESDGSSEASVAAAVFLTVRERILLNLEATLESIQVANGFDHDLVEVHRVDRLGISLKRYPAALIREIAADEGETLSGTTGYTDSTLRIEVGLWTRDFSEVSASEVNALLLDVERALMVDPFRAGLALDTQIQGNALVATDSAEPFARHALRLSVPYREDRTHADQVDGQRGYAYGNFPVLAPAKAQSLSVRERAVRDLVAAIEGISVAAGYQHTVLEVLRLGTRPQAIAGFPSLIVLEPSEAKREGRDAPLGVLTCDLDVAILFLAREVDAGTLPTRVTELLGDLKRAILLDGRRGGVATATRVLRNRQEVDEVSEPLGLYRVDARITYRHDRLDPTLAR